jgi:hypothetical protein
VQDQTSALNQSFPAQTDGFLVGTLRTAKSGPRAFILVRLDNGKTPLAGCCMHTWDASHNYFSVGSFCIPLRQGTTVKPVLNPTDEGYDPAEGTVNTDYFAELHWVPLQNGLTFGPMETRIPRPDAADVYTADTDGFFIGTLNTHGGGGVATIQVSVAAPDLDPRILGGTSVAHHGVGDGTTDQSTALNTVTVPVRAGSAYQARYHIEWNNDHALSAYFYWVPLTQKTR